MPRFTKKMYNEFLLKNSFQIIKHLKQQNDYKKMLDDMEHEENCYFSPSLNYLI